MNDRDQETGREPPVEVLRAYELDARGLQRIESGWINRTWLARQRDGTPRVLQKVNPIFSADTQFDIAWLTAELEQHGVATTKIVATKDGALFYEHGADLWRVLKYIDGITRDSADNPAQVAQAARVLASFHSAVSMSSYRLRSTRGNVHDLPRHLNHLRTTLTRHKDHRHFAAVEDVAGQIIRSAAKLEPLGDFPSLIVHGDPKISNVMFERGSDRAICLIDLDTVTRMPIIVELGDALRSWCNPAGEDADDAAISAAMFDAACHAYAEANQSLLSSAQWRQLPLSTETIAIELAARFCADALEESYFGWDASRYATASDHHLARGNAQLKVARAVSRQRIRLNDIVENAFAAS